MKFPFLAVVGIIVASLPLRGMVFWNLDNSANQTDPGTGAPWGAVAAVTNSTGSLCSGSAVYLGNGYLLTANHVTMDATYAFVTFNGVDFFQIDTSYKSGTRTAGKQVDAGLDMAVFKLTTIPGGIPSVTLLSTPGEQVAEATLVGWGVGRDAGSTLGSTIVTWGNAATSDKRWGTNVVRDALTVSYSGYSFEALRTVAGGTGPSFNPDGVGNAEASATLLDSGSGLFQNISGSWYLIGLTNTVDQQGGASTTTFGDDSVTGAGKGDGNYFTRISSYDDKVLALIPEPAPLALLAAGFGIILLARGSRHGRGGAGSDSGGGLKRWL